jgi:perosamine synthetase
MIPVSKPHIGKEEIDEVMDALKSGYISSIGDKIEEYEEEFAKFCGVSYAASCSNGTTALHLALKAVGVKEGDEVIIPSFTMMATAAAVKYCNAVPVFVDTLMSTWNMNPREISNKITKKTKAIIVVHTYGFPCDMDEINKIARKNNLVVIEDAAEAHGALYNGEPVGSLGDIACFSTYGNKIITTGEGGMVVSNNPMYIARIKWYRNHCFGEPRFIHHDIGYNYRLTNIQAGIGLAQLRKATELIRKRIQIGNWYRKYLSDVPNIFLPPEANKTTTNVYWMFGIVLLEYNKDMLMKELYSAGIDTRSFFYPMHLQPPLLSNETLPVSEFLYNNGLYLPTYYDLTEDEIKFICKNIKRILT